MVDEHLQAIGIFGRAEIQGFPLGAVDELLRRHFEPLAVRRVRQLREVDDLGGNVSSRQGGPDRRLDPVDHSLREMVRVLRLDKQNAAKKTILVRRQKTRGRRRRVSQDRH